MIDIFGALIGEPFPFRREALHYDNTPRTNIPPMSEEEYAMLREHGQCVTFIWQWEKYGPYPTHEAADEAWADALEAEGYIEPKWFNLSRRNEKRPGKRALEILRERRAQGR